MFRRREHLYLDSDPVEYLENEQCSFESFTHPGSSIHTEISSLTFMQKREKTQVTVWEPFMRSELIHDAREVERCKYLRRPEIEPLLVLGEEHCPRPKRLSLIHI